MQADLRTFQIEERQAQAIGALEELPAVDDPRRQDARPAGQGLLATRAAEEYGYVVRDVRRILQVGGAVAAALAVLYVMIDILRVVTIS